MPPIPHEDLKLPSLREDLQLLPGAPTREGEPTWTIFDPIRNAYFQIGWKAYQLLSRWSCRTGERLVEHTRAETTYPATQQDVEELMQFLSTNHLTCESSDGISQMLAAQSDAGEKRGVAAWMHHYLFFKIPLVRPDRVLQATLPLVAPLFSTTAWMLIGILGLIGMGLVSRQWDSFLNTFVHLFTLEGMLAFGIALSFVKIFHELGHAYTATRFGCRVQTMGVAFLVMMPVLFTDTSDAWRLTSRRQRMLISAAGILTELAIAMIATLLWNFLPDGIGRSIMFILATTSWVMSLMINLNPCLRFDGYYLLSDWLGIPSLQSRAFAFGRWKLREWLFALNEPAPEPLSPSIRITLIAYAWCVWIVRAILFLSIALLVYHFFFKALGVLLFTVEIFWFLLWPLAQEVKEWWIRKDRILHTRRAWGVGLTIGILVMLSIIPWSSRVSLPAVQQAAEHTTVFAPVPARIMEVNLTKGQPVAQGDVLLILESPRLTHDIALTQNRIALLQWRLRRQSSTPADLADTHILRQALQTRMTELEGLYQQQDQLFLRAPFTGMIADVPESLHAGQWVNQTLPLAHLVQPDSTEFFAVTSGTDLAYVTQGQQAWFIPDDPFIPSSPAQIREIRQVDEGTSLVPYFASTLGGEVPVRIDSEGKFHPEVATYRVSLDALGSPIEQQQAIRGMIHVEGHSRSFLQNLYQRIVAILLRETGF